MTSSSFMVFAILVADVPSDADEVELGDGAGEPPVPHVHPDVNRISPMKIIEIDG